MTRPEIDDWVNRGVVGDVMTTLDQMPAGSVDLIFLDPPYNLQLPKGKEVRRPDGSLLESIATAEWDVFSDGVEQYEQWTREYLAKAKRVLSMGHGSLFMMGTYHSLYRAGKILQDAGWWLRNDIIWIKSNPTPQFRGVRLCQAHEMIIWATPSEYTKPTFNYQLLKQMNGGKQMRTDWYFPIAQGEQRLKNKDGKSFHETQKPEALMYRIIAGWTNENDIVLDPFFGSGTTGAVAKMLKRRWIGIDNYAPYIKRAMSRINAVEWGVPSKWAMINNTIK